MNKIILHNPTEKIWLDFGKPITVFRASDIEEVLPILEKVEEYVYQKGFYAAGFLSYEASRAFDSALTTFPPTGFPVVCFGIFEKPERLFAPPDPLKGELQRSDSGARGSSPFRGLGGKGSDLNFRLPYSKKQYEKQLSKIRNHIQIGDTYQVNFTFRQRAKFHSDPFQLFQKIGQNALFGAYLDLGDYTICSASPELFFRVENGVIESRPMKGTIQRGRTLEEDLFFKNQLKNSQKDRSENVMITDMIRNDMGKIAESGTVETSKLFEVEKHPTVWQMTSTVRAKTRASFSEILTALFPCASITGAPKIRTTEIIRELENSPRNIYCGTIGYLAPDGKMQFNVAIRTALIDKKRKDLEYGIGGGITWYSDSKKEFEEAILKSKIIRKKEIAPEFSLLETLLWTPENGYFLLEKHLERLADSVRFFDFKVDLEEVKLGLINGVTPPFQRWVKEAGSTHRFNGGSHSQEALRIRLLVSKNGKIFIEKIPIALNNLGGDPKSPPKVVLAKNPVDSSNPFLFHKTTNRKIYQNAKADFPNHYDVIFWNEKGEITEGTFNNIMIKRNGKFITPPVECGLLNGVFRQYLLEKGEISEGIILKEDLVEAEAIYLINSVRKRKSVELDDVFKSRLSDNLIIV